jgi:hypothetical protein
VRHAGRGNCPAAAVHPQGGPDRWVVVGCDGGAIGTVLLGCGKQERHNIATVCDRPTTSKNMDVVLIAAMLRDRHSAPTRAARTYKVMSQHTRPATSTHTRLRARSSELRISVARGPWLRMFADLGGG